MQDTTFLERVRRQAVELGLRGWVRNTQDGRVEALFEGEAEAVRQMIKWFFSDSSGVEVHATYVYQETPSPDLETYEIRSTFLCSEMNFRQMTFSETRVQPRNESDMLAFLRVLVVRGTDTSGQGNDRTKLR